MKVKPLFIYFFVFLIICSLFSGCAPQELPSQNSSEIHTDAPAETAGKTPVETPPSGKIQSVNYIGFITGDGSASNTEKEWAVGGTDLGFPLYNSKTGEMHIFFGDTFDSPSMTGLWRSNVMAVTDDFDLSDGLALKGFLTQRGIEYLTDAHKMAYAIIEGKHNGEEVTKIPTGAIEVNGALYMFYFSKYSWDFKVDSMNYGGAVKSIDGGDTWERVYDLTWTNHARGNNSDFGKSKNTVGNSASDIEILINQNAAGRNGIGSINVAEHEGYFFTQSFPVDGKDGYIYLFGEGGYRTHGIKLGRVLKENFESFASYEYFCGYDETGEPIWLKGRQGLDAILHNSNAYVAGNDTTPYGEHSVAYNAYLKKWVLTYLIDNGSGLNYSLAENIWGPYSAPQTIIKPDWDQLPQDVGSIYCNAIHEKWMADDGKKMYVVFSQYSPIYNSSVLEVVFE